MFSTRFQLQEGLITDVKIKSEYSVAGWAGGLEGAGCFEYQPICKGRLMLLSAGVFKNGGGGSCVHVSAC